MRMMMFLTVFAIFVAVAAGNTCPDGTLCQGKSSCCQTVDDKWGCCPFSDAVCCNDKEHCCPSGTTCDLQNRKCDKGVKSHEWTKIKAAKRPQVLAKNIDVGKTCPDGQQNCSDTYTCCELPSGRYGCCPLKDAVCCSDKIHCCPVGTRCDIDGCSMGKSGEKLHLSGILELGEASTYGEKNLTGHDLKCPTGYTKCPDENGFSKCCPLPNAQCCSDPKIQLCCPQAYTCVPIDGCKSLHSHVNEEENVVP